MDEGLKKWCYLIVPQVMYRFYLLWFKAQGATFHKESTVLERLSILWSVAVTFQLSLKSSVILAEFTMAFKVPPKEIQKI